MGSGGTRQRAKQGSAIAGCLRREGLVAAVASIAMLPVLAGCSSFAPSYSSAPPPPAPAPVAAATSSPPGYPPPAPSPYRAAAAPAYAPQPPPNTYRAASAPPAYAPPPPSYAVAPPPPDYPETGVYPSVSLVDYFRSSLDSASAAPARPVPHPPATYTPEGQPYPAPVASAAAPGAPPPPPAAAAQDDNPTGIYPSQSLSDLFRSSSSPR